MQLLYQTQLSWEQRVRLVKQRGVRVRGFETKFQTKGENSVPGGNFEENQQLNLRKRGSDEDITGGYEKILTIRWVFRPLTQLWASICTLERPSDLHLIFTRLHPRRVKIIIFRVVSELISLRSFKKIRTGTICQGSAPLLSYLLSLRIIGFSTKILSTLMHSLIPKNKKC